MKKLFLTLLFCAPVSAEVVISPNMNLPVPVVGTTTGPDWANNINSCMGSIDSHDHTPGKGVPISSEALNINEDLSLNGNSIIDTKAVVFSPQSSFSTNQGIYVISPDLYYNDGNGNVVRITQSGSVSGASGTITGLPSGTASAAYESVGGTFEFESATNTPANISGASIVISEQVASVTPTAITLKAPAGLAASYNVTFPSAVPSATSLLTMSTSGGLATVGYKAPTIQKFLSGSGTYTTPTGPSPMYIKVKMVGGGGGGGGSGTSGSGDGTDGSSTTFGSSLLTCTGGSKGSNAAAGTPAGGTATINSPAAGVGKTGNPGGSGFTGGLSGSTAGGVGGSSSFLGAGYGGNISSGGAGSAAVANSGSGGGGAGGGAGLISGNGGASGGEIEAIITSPSATYAYSVGAGGTGGTAGSSGVAGGAGGSGQIVVEEYYQ